MHPQKSAIASNKVFYFLPDKYQTISLSTWQFVSCVIYVTLSTLFGINHAQARDLVNKNSAQHDHEEFFSHHESTENQNLNIKTPAQAKLLGLNSLRQAVLQDGGVPLPENLDHFIKNRAAVLQLGKALFWDMQVGSDGVQACASCHFHAGADNRSKNLLNPGLLTFLDKWDGTVKGYFSAAPVQQTQLFETALPNANLKRRDFPFVKDIQVIKRFPDGSINPGANNSNDVSGSMGISLTTFKGTLPGETVDLGTPIHDAIWNINGGANVRRSVPRNSPSVINAVFNYTNFWEGRANPHFNGQNAFGDLDPTAFIVVNSPDGLAIEQISLDNASLASQAVAPPLSFAEMSFGDPTKNNFRTFPELGKKVLSTSTLTGKPLTPLGSQLVHPQDSILASLAKAPQRGLKTNYADLIKAAFVDHYWNSNEPIDTPNIPNTTFNQMEWNFNLFFGLSVALYESTLVADQTPFDHWMENGKVNTAFGNKELEGLNLFINEGQCIKCHAGPELTRASVRDAKLGKNLIRAMSMAKGSALYDNGFYNTSVTPTTDDIGRGGQDPFAQQPIAFSRAALFNRLGIATLPFPLLGNDFIPAKDEDLNTKVCNDTNANGLCEATETILPQFQRVAVDGAFKTPGLRNSALTGPYFHNGSMATLRQVVQFYNRGGNFCSFNIKDLDPTIQPLGLTDKQEERLVDFLVSLTDDRVVYQKAPFDHPELRIPIDGQDTYDSLENVHTKHEHAAKKSGKDTDNNEVLQGHTLKAVGAQGAEDPLNTFLNLNPQDAIYTPVGICIKE